MLRKVVGWVLVGGAVVGCGESGGPPSGGVAGGGGIAGVTGVAGVAGVAGPRGAAGVAGGAGAAGVAGAGATGGASATPVDSSFIGACLIQMMSPEPSTCRGLDAVYDCARKQCNLDACAAKCQDYIACIKAAPDTCLAGISCTHGEPCLTCSTELAGCVWIDKCKGQFVCGTPPVPGGACSKLDACCRTQRDPTACAGFTEQLSMVGGDVSCQMLIDDPGFRKAYTNDPPCTI